MTNPLVVVYIGCLTQEHFVENPSTQMLANLKSQGFEPAPNGCVAVSGECPACRENRTADLMQDLDIADMCGDEEAVREYAQEIRTLQLRQ